MSDKDPIATAIGAIVDSGALARRFALHDVAFERRRCITTHRRESAAG